MEPFRGFVVGCDSPDAVDDYRFEVTQSDPAWVTLRETHARGDLPVIDFIFDARAFDEAALRSRQQF